jgi:hypothetical protein
MSYEQNWAVGQEPRNVPRKEALGSNTVISSATCDNSEHVCIQQQILNYVRATLLEV